MKFHLRTWWYFSEEFLLHSWCCFNEDWSRSPRASFSQSSSRFSKEFLLHSWYLFRLAYVLMLLLLNLVRRLYYTPNACFSGVFIIHPWYLEVLVRSFDYTPGANFSEEFRLRFSCPKVLVGSFLTLLVLSGLWGVTLTLLIPNFSQVFLLQCSASFSEEIPIHCPSWF